MLSFKSLSARRIGVTLGIAAMLCGVRVTQALLSQPATTRVLVLNDLGTSEDVVAEMQAYGWDVTTADLYQLAKKITLK